MRRIRRLDATTGKLGRWTMPRYLYHAVAEGTPVDETYEPPSLRSEGFIHCSFAPAVRESVSLYMADVPAIDVVCIDPTQLGSAELRIAETPRGPMPHVHGRIPRTSVIWRKRWAALPEVLPDAIA